MSRPGESEKNASLMQRMKRSVLPFWSEKRASVFRRPIRYSSMTRRGFLGWLAGLSLSPLFPSPVVRTRAEAAVSPRTEKGRSIAQFFKGEELVYEIGFWFFKRAAIGKLTFLKEERKGRYSAVLQAETQGVLGWLARYRADTYRATMEEVDGGTRLRAVSFEENVKIGSKVKRKTHVLDYTRRKWIVIKERKGTTERTEEEIPPGMIYDDFVTAAYNFRYGVYGEVERGKKYSVATFPRKGSTHYEVRVASKEEEEKKRSEKSKRGKEFYVELLLNPEITHSKEGIIEGWLSKELFPLEGTMKDVVLFGDVRGALIRNSRS